MTTRDKVAQVVTAFMGDAVKSVIKKATTRIDAPPKKKHIIVLIRYLANPRANIIYIVDCLSLRYRKDCWMISLKALMTTHYLLNAETTNFIIQACSRPSLFELSGYVDNSSMLAVEMSPREFLRVYTSENNRIIFLLESLNELEATEAAIMISLYKALIKTHGDIQMILDLASRRGIDGLSGLKFVRPSPDIISSIEDYVRDIIKQRGSRKLKKEWNIEDEKYSPPTEIIKPILKNQISFDFDPFSTINALEQRYDPTTSTTSDYENFDLFSTQKSVVNHPAITSSRDYTSTQPAIGYYETSSRYETQNIIPHPPLISWDQSLNQPQQLISNQPQKPKDMDQLMLENIDFTGSSNPAPFQWNSHTLAFQGDDKQKIAQNNPFVHTNNPFL
ncbi:hypothetical protein HZS_3055 [Henneguya salminicola]|nr:hypothetical protein HZS_3055 [Henneguya salminicola]